MVAPSQMSKYRRVQFEVRTVVNPVPLYLSPTALPPSRMKPFASDSEDDSDTDAEPIDFDKLAPLEPGPGEHKLQYTYCLWFKKGVVRRAQTTKVEEDYSKSLHCIGRCASVEQWWSLYSHLIKPTSLKPYRELHLFKVGRPLFIPALLN